MFIPHTALETDTLNALIEDFASRDGTDYGESELSLAEKTARIRLLLDKGTMVISFDPETESCALQRANF